MDLQAAKQMFFASERKKIMVQSHQTDSCCSWKRKRFLNRGKPIFHAACKALCRKHLYFLISDSKQPGLFPASFLIKHQRLAAAFVASEKQKFSPSCLRPASWFSDRFSQVPE